MHLKPLLLFFCLTFPCRLAAQSPFVQIEKWINSNNYSKALNLITKELRNKPKSESLWF